MPRRFTPQQASKALSDYEKQMRTAIVVPFRQSLKEGRKRIIESFKERGIGRGLWSGRGKLGKGGKRMKPVVKTERVRFSRSNQGFVGGIRARGIAAIIERGGKLDAHEIKPNRKKFLRFQTPTGFAFAEKVHNPGSRIPKRPVIQKGLDKVSEVMRPRIDASLQALSNDLL